jgi:hypothetical protein
MEAWWGWIGGSDGAQLIVAYSVRYFGLKNILDAIYEQKEINKTC